MIITELYFFGVKWFEMTLVWSKGTNVTLSIIWAQIDEIVWAPKWILPSHTHLQLFLIFVEDCVNFDAVEAMVLVTSFPSDDFETSSFPVAAFGELHDKFEFKSLTSNFFDFWIRNFGYPVVSFGPRHLYPALASFLVWVPQTQKLFGSDKP